MRQSNVTSTFLWIKSVRQFKYLNWFARWIRTLFALFLFRKHIVFAIEYFSSPRIYYEIVFVVCWCALSYLYVMFNSYSFKKRSPFFLHTCNSFKSKIKDFVLMKSLGRKLLNIFKAQLLHFQFYHFVLIAKKWNELNYWESVDSNASEYIYPYFRVFLSILLYHFELFRRIWVDIFINDSIMKRQKYLLILDEAIAAANARKKNIDS